jgi:hypothetical protein
LAFYQDTDSTSSSSTTTEINSKETILNFKHFNWTNPHKKSWCPKSSCNNSPVCAPCNRRFLFILSTGRSGSTSLLKMLNQLPNVRLSGENYNALFQAHHILKVLENHPDEFFDKDVMKEGRYMHNAVEDGPFVHNAMPKGSSACVMQRVIEFLNPPPLQDQDLPFDAEDEAKRIIGAKMIRLQNGDWKPQRMTTFLKQNFPCARFIINIRSDIDRQAKSMVESFVEGGETKNFDETVEDIKNQTIFLQELAENLQNRARLINMEEWKNDVSVLNDVIGWLGFKGCAFKDTIHENHGGFEHDKSTSINLGSQCRYPFV